jgi:hypothetical protein
MDDSEQTHQDNDQDEADIDGTGQRKPHVLEKFMTRQENIAKHSGGSYKWQCNVCSTPDKPSIFSGSASKVMFHFLPREKGTQIRECVGILGNQESLTRLKEARNLMKQHRDSLQSKKRQRHEAEASASMAKRTDTSIKQAESSGQSTVSVSRPAQQQAVTEFFRSRTKQDKQHVDAVIAKFCYNQNISFRTIASDDFHEVCSAISDYGGGKQVYHPPNREQLAGALLDQHVQSLSTQMGQILEQHREYGITVTSDGWTDCAGDCIYFFAGLKFCG